jgi:hypothetical protein
MCWYTQERYMTAQLHLACEAVVACNGLLKRDGSRTFIRMLGEEFP